MDDPEINDEATRIWQEVLVTATDLAETKYYGHIAGLFRDNPEFQSHLDRVLGPDSEPALMVIYALGSPELSHNSQYQLAVATLLKRDFPNRIGDIELYDPVFSPADHRALEMLGLRVLPANEHFRRPANKPTLFFLPSANFWHVGNLLEANWCASKSNRMMILSNSLYDRDPDEKPLEKDLSLRRQVYSGILSKYATEFDIPTDFHDSYLYIFGNLSFSFFDIDPKVDLESLLPDDFKQRRKKRYWKSDESDCVDNHNDLRDLVEQFFWEQFELVDEVFSLPGYRFPRQQRCQWQPPPAGWLKLNFSGKARDGVSPAGCGGILRDECENVITTYSCSLGELADTTVANAEALRMGMRLLEDVPGGVKQLVVEGTDLSVVRWASSGPEPPEKVKEAMDDILKVVARMRMVIYHVYEEANKAAISLAKEGATSQDQHVWSSSKIVGEWAENLAKLTIK